MRPRGAGAEPATFGTGIWRQLARRHWRRQPVHLVRPLPQPFTTTEEVFAVLVRAGERYQAGDASAKIRFYVEQGLQQADIPQHLPCPADGSLVGYAERMRLHLGGRRFGLVLNDQHVHDVPLWWRVRELLGGLAARVRLPPRSVSLATFVGTYARTPFGVHRDAASTLAFVVAGRKTFRFWPGPFFAETAATRNSVHYDQFVPEALTVHAEVGDVVAWPASYWHVAEGGGDLSVTLSVAAFRSGPPHQEAGDDVAALVAERLRTLTKRRRRGRAPVATRVARPVPFVEAVGRALADLHRDHGLVRTLLARWVTGVSGGGLHAVPAPTAPAPLTDDDVVCGDPRAPIVWAAAPADEIVVSANGHAFGIAAHPGILALLARLNDGKPGRVGTLLSAHAGTVKANGTEFRAAPTDIRALLERLVSLRALTTATHDSHHPPHGGTPRMAKKKSKPRATKRKLAKLRDLTAGRRGKGKAAAVKGGVSQVIILSPTQVGQVTPARVAEVTPLRPRF